MKRKPKKRKVRRVVLGEGFLAYALNYKKGACNGSGFYETIHLEHRFKKGMPVKIGDGGDLRDKRIRLIAEVLD